MDDGLDLWEACVCNCCLEYLLIFGVLNIHGMYNVWLCVVYKNPPLFVGSNGKNMWDIITRKVCEISIAIDLSILVMKRCLLSHQAISLGNVMCVWDIHIWSTSGIGMWLHTVECICSGVSYWGNAGSGFLQNTDRLHIKCDGTRAATRFNLSAKWSSHQRGRQFSRLLTAEVCAQR